jgi:hypothetical protein
MKIHDGGEALVMMVVSHEEQAHSKEVFRNFILDLSVGPRVALTTRRIRSFQVHSSHTFNYPRHNVDAVLR